MYNPLTLVFHIFPLFDYSMQPLVKCGKKLMFLTVVFSYSFHYNDYVELGIIMKQLVKYTQGGMAKAIAYI